MAIAFAGATSTFLTCAPLYTSWVCAVIRRLKVTWRCRSRKSHSTRFRPRPWHNPLPHLLQASSANGSTPSRPLRTTAVLFIAIHLLTDVRRVSASAGEQVEATAGANNVYNVDNEVSPVAGPSGLNVASPAQLPHTVGAFLFLTTVYSLTLSASVQLPEAGILAAVDEAIRSTPAARSRAKGKGRAA